MLKFVYPDFVRFPIVNGLRKCPTGDYTQMDKFERCIFEPNCVFKDETVFELCKFGENTIFHGQFSFCEFAENCVISNGHFKNCKYGAGCIFSYAFFEQGAKLLHECYFSHCKFNEVSFGNDCRFDKCAFSGSRFGENCVFTNGCTFFDNNSFAEGCMSVNFTAKE